LYKELENEYNTLLREEEGKNYIITLEEGNLAKRKKTIAYEREYDNIRSKVKEKNI
jgi:hypothetical protein